MDRGWTEAAAPRGHGVRPWGGKGGSTKLSQCTKLREVQTSKVNAGKVNLLEGDLLEGKCKECKDKVSAGKVLSPDLTRASLARRAMRGSKWLCHHRALPLRRFYSRAGCSDG